MANNPYSSYSQQQHNNEDSRVSEARALLRCAAVMEEAQAEGISYLDYCDAIRHNQKLWTLFQSTLLEQDNKLPNHLKDVLKNLSIYIDRRSLRAIGTQNPASLNVLININKEIAAGLMESVKNSQAADMAAGSVAPTQGQSSSIADMA